MGRPLLLAADDVRPCHAMDETRESEGLYRCPGLSQ